jgi:hypothetical protein
VHSKVLLMIRLAWLGFVLTLAGCVLPFVHSQRQERHTPDAVRRFAKKAHALARAPGTPSLSEVTRAMGVAIDALEVKGGDQLALEVGKKADAMTQSGPAETDALARESLDSALEAVRRVEATVSRADQEKAVETARQAIEKLEPQQPATLHVAYGEVARAMVVVSGGHPRIAAGGELSQLVSRFALEQPADARRTGAQVIAAMADALERLPGHDRGAARELRKRAERLANAPPLDYSGQLKDALVVVVDSLERDGEPARRQRTGEAKAAVYAIRADRPLDLQQAAAADALRIVSDAITAR